MEKPAVELPDTDDDTNRVLVVGAGPIGRDVAAFLETSGWRVTVLDLSPVNVHPFSQQGFRTVAGDAREDDTLRRAEVSRMRLAIVCLPDDEIAAEVTKAIRAANSACAVIVRCRYLLNMATAKAAGAAQVVSEEGEAARALLAAARRVVDGAKSDHSKAKASHGY